MTQKYKIMSHLKELSDSEINSYKDFDGLLALHKKASKKWKMKAIIYSTILVATVATISYLYIEKKSLFDKKNTAKVPIVASEKVATAASKFESSNQNPNETNGESSIKIESSIPQNQKYTVEKLNSTTPTKPAVEVKSTVQSGFEEAQPAGGYPALYDFFKQNVQYPEQSKKQKIEGSVLVEFYVNENGKPVEVTILKGINTETDEEAMRLIKSMPTWQPALVEGKPVSMKLTIPLTFQIHSNSK